MRKNTLSWYQRIILHYFEAILNQFDHGALTITLPDKTQRHFGDQQSTTSAHITITNAEFFSSIKRGGEIGLGESYMKGEWTSPAPQSVIEYMIGNMPKLRAYTKGAWLVWIKNVLSHRLRKNTKKNSRVNIADHYDLGNSFYELFLDETMMYSSGYYIAKKDTLHEAQQQKVKRLIEKLQLKDGDHVLEIGTGWGYVAIEMAKSCDCKVDTITLSTEQKEYVEKRVKAAGLSDKISVELVDYRDKKGEFNAIISIEMIEAVGHEYLSNYFEQCDALLKPNGRFALQVITYPDEFYERYTNNTDFIREYIFPGGHLPCLNVINHITANKTQLSEISRFNIAQGYANTLRDWREKFNTEQATIRKMGFSDMFCKKWNYYFAYCEAAFRTNYLGCYQIVFEKH